VKSLVELVAVFMLMSVLAAPVTGRCQAGEVIVQLRDGSTLRGMIDKRTDHELVWLRTSTPRIVLRSAIEWEQIVNARYDDQTLATDGLRELVPQLQSDTNQDIASKEPPKLPPSQDIAPVGTNRADSRSSSANRRVRSLQIEAVVANWDDDVETDGLRVFVYPLDANGRIVPINGRINFKLIGQTVNQSTNDRFRRRSLFPELGRWSQRVRKSDFEPSGAVYEIPFRNFHPEFNLEIAPHALLTARLGIPGRGSFAASYDNLHLRPLSYIRDELQGRTQRRFFSQEHPNRHAH